MRRWLFGIKPKVSELCRFQACNFDCGISSTRALRSGRGSSPSAACRRLSAAARATETRPSFMTSFPGALTNHQLVCAASTVVTAFSLAETMPTSGVFRANGDIHRDNHIRGDRVVFQLVALAAEATDYRRLDAGENPVEVTAMCCTGRCGFILDRTGSAQATANASRARCEIPTSGRAIRKCK